MDQVKQFLNIFNRGVREKLTNPAKKEMGFELVHKLKNIFNRDIEEDNANTPTGINEKGTPKEKVNTNDKYANMFDF